MTSKHWIAALLAGWLAAPAWAADGVMLRDDSLRSAASAGSAVVGKAAKGSPVDILARKGGWTQVRTAGRTGWVRLLSVRATAADGGKDDLAAVAALTQKRDSGKVVAVAGLRGLNEEELRSAQFDAAELRRLESYGVAGAEARKFAADGGLAAVAVNELPAPQRETSGNSGSGWGGN